MILPNMEATNTSPLITIGVTCFNAEDTIVRAIQSAQKQTYPNFEIVIVDDASTDNSIKIIEEMQREDQRISLHRHDKNQGVAAARNSIIEHAKGEYVAFFDDDDESMPSRLSKQYERLSRFQQERPGVPVLCYCHRTYIKPGEKERIFLSAGYRTPEPHGEMVVDFLLWNKQRGHNLTGDFGSGVMMASHTLLQRFKFDPQFRRTEDWDITIRTALEGGYFVSVDESLVNQYATKTDDKSDAVVLQYLLMLLNKNKKYLKKKNIYYASIAYMHVRFYHDRKHAIKKYLFLTLACLLAPKEILEKNSAKNRDEETPMTSQ